MTNMQPSSERRNGNELLSMSQVREALVGTSADNALYAGQVTRPAIVDTVLREMATPDRPVQETAPSYPAASMALNATVDAGPNLLEDTRQPDMFDEEAYLRSLEGSMGEQVDAAYAEQAMGQQVDEAFREAGYNDIEAARANVNALFERAESGDDTSAYAGQGA